MRELSNVSVQLHSQVDTHGTIHLVGVETVAVRGCATKTLTVEKRRGRPILRAGRYRVSLAICGQGDLLRIQLTMIAVGFNLLVTDTGLVTGTEHAGK